MDWSKPGSSVLRRLSDHRVRQFWDSNHILSAVLKQAEAVDKVHPPCCERKGILWDLMAVYARGTHWDDILPSPMLLNGPVVHTAKELDRAVSGN